MELVVCYNLTMGVSKRLRLLLSGHQIHTDWFLRAGTETVWLPINVALDRLSDRDMERYLERMTALPYLYGKPAYKTIALGIHGQCTLWAEHFIDEVFGRFPDKYIALFTADEPSLALVKRCHIVIKCADDDAPPYGRGIMLKHDYRPDLPDLESAERVWTAAELIGGE